MSRQAIETREPATERVTPGPDRDAVPLRGLRTLTATYDGPLDSVRSEKRVPEHDIPNSMTWEWKRKRLSVTKEDFITGKAMDCKLCPVATALKRVVRRDAKSSFAVQAQVLEFRLFDEAGRVVMHVESKLSKRAIEFIEKYDCPQQHQTFELPMRVFVKIPGWMLR